MTNLFEKLFCLSMTASILSITPASAQSEWSDRDSDIYNYGFTYGSLVTLCDLLYEGEIAESSFRKSAEITKSNTKGKTYKFVLDVLAKSDEDFIKKCLPYIQ